HHLAVAGLRLSKPLLPLLSPLLISKDPLLERKIFGLKFPNPVGLAAGLDKNGELADVWGKVGFGFAELGTFTALPQPGNEKPRIFRIPSQRALINRMGFPNLGAEAVAFHLKRLKQSGRWPSIPIGINIGKSKLRPLEEAAEDYLESLQYLKPYADYVAVNVSSPNTPGLRKLQAARPLKKLLNALVKASSGKPVLLKLAPDLAPKPLKQAADAALSAGCAGLIATNTTLSREELPLGKYEEGGLSGVPLQGKSLRILEALSRMTKGKVPLVAVGGIFTAQDARRRLEAGASLVQVYTGYIYEGPGLPARICRELLNDHFTAKARRPRKKI
ncbi:MAG TPA: quinone-dependent dihydroorotate dehydrogenase, partial [bacterium]|nr:quinone-dependent dihydroorotate dehydrogenase [bacterium]